MRPSLPPRSAAVLVIAAIGVSGLPAFSSPAQAAAGARPSPGAVPRVVTRPAPDDGVRQTTLRVDRSRRALSTAATAPRTAPTGAASPRARSATPLSTWTVNYGSGFTGRDEAKGAFQRAVDTWAHSVSSPVPIVVTADLSSSLGTDVLGTAGPTVLCLDANGLVYPQVLENALTAKDNDVECGNTPENQNDGSDITATFSSSNFFYYGADPAGIGAAACTADATPEEPNPQPVVGTCFDFESLVLHELGHGLGMLGSAYVDDEFDVGFWGDDAGNPFVYDYYTKTSDGTFILDITNGSRQLALALTDDDLYWDGPEGASADRGRDPQLFAPNDPTAPLATSDGFQDGSSYSHLDADAYDTPDADALMSPYAQPLDVTRDPGEVLLGMFRDMGWVTPGLPGTRFTPLTPQRLLDTGTAVPGGRVTEIDVTAPAEVPSNATAVVLNLTVDRPSSSSVLRSYPRGRRSTAPIPLVSNVNTATGDTRANLVTVPVGTGGRVRLYNTGGAARLIADLAGFYAPDATDVDTGFTPASTPVRLMDTRNGTGVRPGTLGPGGVVDLKVTELQGVPADATAVTLTVTAVTPTTRAYLAVYPTGAAAGTSNINLLRGATAANQVVVKVGDGGMIRFLNSAGSTHVLADLAGWYDAGTSGALFRPTKPTRVLDTRPGAQVVAGGIREIDFAAETVAAGVPLAATAVVANLTGVGPTGPTYLTAYPTGSAVPVASNVNLARGQTAASLVTVRLGSNRMRVRNNAGAVDLLLDVAGWFGPA